MATTTAFRHDVALRASRGSGRSRGARPRSVLVCAVIVSVAVLASGGMVAGAGGGTLTGLAGGGTVALLAGGETVAGQGRAELVERTLAIVGGSAITLSDVQAAMALGLVRSTTDINVATEALVDRALMLREVDRYAPPEPDAARIDERLTQIRQRLDAAQITTILAASGVSETRLRAWIRDDLRIETYLNQRFAADGPERRESLIADWVSDLRRRTPVVELWKQ